MGPMIERLRHYTIAGRSAYWSSKVYVVFGRVRKRRSAPASAGRQGADPGVLTALLAAVEELVTADPRERCAAPSEARGDPVMVVVDRA
jgi:hypothetical protein